MGCLICLFLLAQIDPVLAQDSDPTDKKTKLVIDQVQDDAFPKLIAHVAVNDENGAPITKLRSDDLNLIEISGIDAKESIVKSSNLSVGNDAHHPVRVVIVVDAVVDPVTLQSMVAGLKNFVDQIQEKDSDSALIYSIDSQRPALVSNFSSDRVALKLALDSIQPIVGSHTALIDGMGHGIQEFSGPASTRRALIVVTDYGGDANADKIDPVIQAANQNHVPVYVIGYKLQAPAASVQHDALKSLAEKTSGSIFDQDDASRAVEALNVIAQNLKHQFVVSYTSTLNVSEQPHQLRICIPSTTSADTCSQNVPYRARPTSFNLGLQLPEIVGSGRIPIRAEIGNHLPNVVGIDYVISDNKSTVTTLEGKPPSFEAIWDTSGITPGAYTIHAQAIDAIGNIGELTLTMQITHSLPLATEISSPKQAATKSSVSPLIIVQMLGSFMLIGLAIYLLSRILLLARQSIQRQCKLKIQNTGNTASQYTLRAFDKEGALWITYSHEGLPLELTKQMVAEPQKTTETLSTRTEGSSANSSTMAGSRENIYRVNNMAMSIANAITTLSAFFPMLNGMGLFGLANRIRRGQRLFRRGEDITSQMNVVQSYQETGSKHGDRPLDRQSHVPTWIKTSTIDPGEEFEITMTAQALAKRQDSYSIVIESLSLDDPSAAVRRVERPLSVGNISSFRRWLPALLALSVVGFTLFGIAWLANL